MLYDMQMFNVRSETKTDRWPA